MLITIEKTSVDPSKIVSVFAENNALVVTMENGVKISIVPFTVGMISKDKLSLESIDTALELGRIFYTTWINRYLSHELIDFSALLKEFSVTTSFKNFLKEVS